MIALPYNQPEDLHLLKEKCRNLESQCAAYIRSLEVANDDLEAEITKGKKAEAAIRNAHDELEKLVAERTKEIRLLKDRLQAENVFLKQELAASHAYGTIIGDSHPIKTVISQIELVASTDANVLIHGESGTGKELVAREIHKHSNRKEKPLIKVNCATIPKELYESEFFGHVKGSFTGAVKDRIGRFEAADYRKWDQPASVIHCLLHSPIRQLWVWQPDRMAAARAIYWTQIIKEGKPMMNAFKSKAKACIAEG